MMTDAEERTYLKNVSTYCGTLIEHINDLAKIEVSRDFAYCLNRAAGMLLLARGEVDLKVIKVREVKA